MNELPQITCGVDELRSLGAPVVQQQTRAALLRSAAALIGMGVLATPTLSDAMPPAPVFQNAPPAISGLVNVCVCVCTCVCVCVCLCLTP